MSEMKSIVLRVPAEGGDFNFRIAKLADHDAEQVEQRVATGCVDRQTLELFGPALNLSQTMRNLDTRDFKVFDLPARDVQHA